MADTLQFDLVSPERRLASVAATQVQIPGMAGDFTAMPNHAPFLTTLRPGIVRVGAAGGTSEYVVTGGFAEVSPDAATILAEVAVPREEARATLVEDLVAEAEKALGEATDDTRQVADQRLRDARELQKRLKA
jgi:F-type H+-transporting ATPase subunit epsilon